MDPQNLASGSGTGTSNAPFGNVYHLLQRNPQFYQFPNDPMNYGMLHQYQSPPIFNVQPSSLMNHQIFGFPAVITPAPQVPANLTQWQAPVPSAESNSDHMRCESVSPPGASTSVLVSQQSFNESVSHERGKAKRKRKFKKRSMQEQLSKKEWNKEDADLALQTEYEHGNIKKKQQIVIKFPDEELNAEVVKQFHSGIKFVHFQTSCGPRYCFAQIDENIDVNSVIKDLNVTKFQNGCLKAERKLPKEDEEIYSDEIDPYTLYLGNLPQNITSNVVKEKFKKASRIDIGFAQKIKYTRYAFIRFKNVYDAVAAYKENVDCVIGNRSVVLRFRRINKKEENGSKERKKIKLEEDVPGVDSEFTAEKNDEEKNHSKCCPGKEEDLSVVFSSIKTENNRGYADEAINEASHTLQPVFGTLFERNDSGFISKYLQFVENSNDMHFSSENSKSCSDMTPLGKLISQVTGVPEVSTHDIELFKTVVLKLADIFKNSMPE